MFHFPVQLAGSAALRALNAAGEGRVLAVFRRSFYVETNDGLICIGPPSIGAGPLNAICTLPEGIDWNASGVQQEGRVQVKNGSISVWGRLEFSFKEAQEWRPVSISSKWKPADLMLGLSRLAEEAKRRSPSDGLGSLIPEIARGHPVERIKIETNDLFLKAAIRGIVVFMIWLREVFGENGTAVGGPQAEAEGLIGLGPGLTPSGDDFVGGAMIALRVFGRSAIAGHLADWVIQLARERTSLISQAHMACAADGMGMGALHEMLREISRPGETGFPMYLDGINSVGHTSGWDTLAGATAVCSILQSG